MLMWFWDRFVVPDGISVDELKSAGLPEGVSCDIAEAK
jgi:hypothetical protein